MALYNNYPYTNFHELNLDWIIQTVKNIESQWANFTDDVQAVAFDAANASVTVSGSLQEGLTFNFGLPRGASGADGADGVGIASAYLDPVTYTLTLTFTDGNTYTTTSIRGPQGPEGPTGQGINIIDTVATSADLPVSGNPGDAYLVGSGSPYDLYVWLSSSNTWIDSGSIGSSVSPSSATPQMDGTATAGVDTTYARGDHVHPSDTTKQDTLVSGTNIKTINSTSLLGSSDIAVQPVLVSGTNIATINGNTLLTSGNIAVQPVLVSGTSIKTINSTDILGAGNISVQPTLVSGTNIATIDGVDLLNGGNVRTVHVYSGSSDPNDDDPAGSQNGDLYIQTGA